MVDKSLVENKENENKEVNESEDDNECLNKIVVKPIINIDVEITGINSGTVV